MGVLWTSVDIVRFTKGEHLGPVTLWIGVTPTTLSCEDAHTTALECLNTLKTYGITDVEVEYRESIYTDLAGPSLLKPVSTAHPTAEVRGPLTLALRLSITAEATPYTQGTGGLYFTEGGKSKRVMLLTTWHILFPSDKMLTMCPTMCWLILLQFFSMSSCNSSSVMNTGL